MLLDHKACQSGSDSAYDKATKGCTQEHLLAPPWQCVLSSAEWASAWHRDRCWDYIDKGPLPALTVLTGWLWTDSSTGNCKFSWWMLGENKFWVLRNYRREPFMKEGVREGDLGKVKAELGAHQSCLEAEGRWRAAGVWVGVHHRMENIQSVLLGSWWGQAGAWKMGRSQLQYSTKGEL